MHFQRSKIILYSCLTEQCFLGHVVLFVLWFSVYCLFINYIPHLVFNDVRVTLATLYRLRASGSIQGSEGTAGDTAGVRFPTHRRLVGETEASAAHRTLESEIGYEPRGVPPTVRSDPVLYRRLSRHHIRGGGQLPGAETVGVQTNACITLEIQSYSATKPHRNRAYRQNTDRAKGLQSRLVDIRSGDHSYEIILPSEIMTLYVRNGCALSSAVARCSLYAEQARFTSLIVFVSQRM